VKIGRELSAEDFIVSYPEEGRVDVNVIGIVEQQIPTQHLIFPMDASNGRISIDRERDLAKIAVVERHKGTGEIQVGFVNGFGFSSDCAIASTVAHDSHHMIVVGTDEGNMAIAANELGRIGGGQVVVLEGKIIGLVELPIAGLMSDERADIVAQKVETILEGIRATGCKLRNANMHLSFLALVVIPELRISDIGLVDVVKFEVVPLVKESQ
jgi:adenine deaminase